VINICRLLNEHEIFAQEMIYYSSNGAPRQTCSAGQIVITGFHDSKRVPTLLKNWPFPGPHAGRRGLAGAGDAGVCLRPAVVLAHLVLSRPAALASTRAATWYGFAALALALPYPVLKTCWALGGTLGLRWPGADGLAGRLRQLVPLGHGRRCRHPLVSGAECSSADVLADVTVRVRALPTSRKLA
jgi:hypothetical protein